MGIFTPTPYLFPPNLTQVLMCSLTPAHISVKVLFLSFLLASIQILDLSVTVDFSLPSPPLSQHYEGLWIPSRSVPSILLFLTLLLLDYLLVSHLASCVQALAVSTRGSALPAKPRFTPLLASSEPFNGPLMPKELNQGPKRRVGLVHFCISLGTLPVFSICCGK